jgi:hypothetical protein
MTKKSMAKFSLLAASILALPALACAGTATDGKEAKSVVEKTKESCITGDIGINVVSQYVSRGVIFENQGGIIEPYADLYFKLYEGEGFLNKMTLNLGIWNSFHSRHTDAGLVNGSGTSSTRSWYEFDFTAGISFTFAKNFTFTPSYFTFLSPNDGFSTFQGLNLKLAYDTTDLFGFNLAPYAQVCSNWKTKREPARTKEFIMRSASLRVSRSDRSRCRFRSWQASVRTTFTVRLTNRMARSRTKRSAMFRAA